MRMECEGPLRRRAFIVLACLSSTGLSPWALAQEGRVWRIGLLASRSASIGPTRDPYYAAFVQGMRDRGYVEGRHFTVEWRTAQGDADTAEGLAADLVSKKVDVIVAVQTVATQAATQATSSIPIVMASA